MKRKREREREREREKTSDDVALDVNNENKIYILMVAILSNAAA